MLQTARECRAHVGRDTPGHGHRARELLADLDVLHESPSKYLDPLTSIWLGLLALAVTRRSRAMLTLCGTLVATNVALFVLGANGVRSGSWRDRLLSDVGRVFGAIGAGPLTVSGLLLLAAAAYIAIRGMRARERS